jgi:hypothetical protein
MTEDFITAIITAAFIAATAWVYSWVRNLFLEKSLKGAINQGGVGIGFDHQTNKCSFTLQIQNNSNATIRVRAIIFMADKFHVELHPSHDKPLFQTPLTNEVVQSVFKRKHLLKGSLEPDDNPHAMLLPPKTGGWWDVAPDTIGSREWIIEEIYMVFEYATVFGNSALVRIKAPESTLKMVKENFERLSVSAHRKMPFDFFHGMRPKPHGL